MFFFVISAIVLAVVMQGAAAAWRHLLCILTKLYVLYVLYVKSAVSLKWQVRIQNDKKITPIFTITFSSKMLIKQCFTSLEPTFLDDGLNSL